MYFIVFYEIAHRGSSCNVQVFAEEKVESRRKREVKHGRLRIAICLHVISLRDNLCSSVYIYHK